MRGLHFSLLQLIFCIGFITLVAIIFIITFQPQPSIDNSTYEAIPSIPYMEIQTR